MGLFKRKQVPGAAPASQVEPAAGSLEDALQICQASFEAIVARSADGIVVVDPDGRICFVNPAGARMLGRPSEALQGAAFGVPVADGETAEIDLLDRGSPTRVAEMRVVSTRWRGAEAFLATLRDVTERKRAEEEAREAVRRRDEFLATLSHELRNPLAAVTNASLVMRSAALTPGAFANAREIVDRQCRQMTRLLEDLLDVSRVSQGKIELRRECHDLELILREATDAVSALMQQREQRLELSAPDEPVYVDVDGVRIHQVLVNLLSNAAKYSDRRRRVWVTVSRTAAEAVISVRDDGVGMSAKMLQTVFEPFVQVGTTLARSNGGLGIGLWLVRNIVELHGGTVSALSDGPGRGSEFTVRLPLSERRPEEQTKTIAARATRGLRILIVEDNADNRIMLKTLLELEGHEVEACEDGAQGVQVIEFQHPDVALVDIGLPGLDGYQVAQQVRANPANEEVFLVALTGYGQLRDRRRALQAGFDAHLSKPVDLDELSRLLAECSKSKCGTTWHDVGWVNPESAG